MRGLFRFLIILEAVCLGLTLILFFTAGVYLPVAAGVLVMIALTLSGLLIEVRFPSILPRLAVVLYALPFSVTAGFLFDRRFVWWEGPSVVGLIDDTLVNQQMLMIGAVGLAGLVLGIAAVGRARTTPQAAPDLTTRRRATLGLISFSAVLALSVFLSWLSAPTQTIFTAAYASEGTQDYASSTLNFNAAYLASYILMILLFIDCEREAVPFPRRLKRTVVITATLVIVIFLQVLRGDRESMGLIVALMALYLTGPDIARHRRNFAELAKRRAFKIAIPAVAIVVGFIVLGAARSILSPEARDFRRSPQEVVKAGFAQNTWTAVLLTNLALAGMYSHGEMDYLYGRTYIDYFLSLPPGVVTRVLGVERPLESNRGPAQWFVGVSAGGIHLALVPFRNFGVAGLFIITTLFGAGLAALEQRRNAALLWRLLYGAILTSSFFWFWYGDMNVIRAVLIALILAFAYRAWLAVVELMAPSRRALALGGTGS